MRVSERIARRATVGWGDPLPEPLSGGRTLAQAKLLLGRSRILGNVGDLRGDLLARFRWVNGHADVWRLFYDGEVFTRLVVALADPYRGDGITKVAGIEARGFILGSAVARDLRAGFVAIRKQGTLFPGEKLARRTATDYRGVETELRLQSDSVTTADRVLLVDDWFETGSQGLAAKALIEEAGGELAGASVVVDQLPPDTRGSFGRYSALIAYSALPHGEPKSLRRHS
jgi:adenine phosphoribosyltransferase